ncbi:hypothetical protein [Francisella sp. TX07-6608]|uniref:hypothetical protein n=1 Tax=Francisella sp. TX07-6608 TaxID=573568 RepID=UPI0008F997D8|nr:hypothetical protein [Francisella sp. TX07-6608]
MIKKLITRLKNTYPFKLDSYYKNKKTNEVYCRFRVRNKRTHFTLSMSEINKDLKITENLHPMDVCIIGILRTNPGYFEIYDNNFDSFNNDHLFERLNTNLDIIDCDYHNSILTLKNKDKIIKISFDDLFRISSILGLIKPNDALLLGSMISLSDQKYENIFSKREKVDLYKLFLVSFFIAVVMLTVICAKRIIYDINFEVIACPFICLNYIGLRRVFNTYDLDKIIKTIVIAVFIFVMYFNLIVHLPYNSKYLPVELFNDHVETLFYNTVSFITSFLIMVYALLKAKIRKYDIILASAIFWSVTLILQRFYNIEISDHDINYILVSGVLLFLYSNLEYVKK